MPSQLRPRFSDEHIAELYRASLLNPGRFTVWCWDAVDYVSFRRFALRPGFVALGSVVVVLITG